MREIRRPNKFSTSPLILASIFSLSSIICQADPCPLLPIHKFESCVLRSTHSVDELMNMIPPTASGRSPCETINILRSSESPQGEDIQASTSDQQPPQYGLLCGNGDVFTRLTTNPKGAHWRELELIIRNGKSLVPIRVEYSADGKPTFQINPVAVSKAGENEHGSGKSCTDCHGHPMKLKFPAYPEWPNSVASGDDQKLQTDQVKDYQAFLSHFEKRTEVRFKPVIDSLKAIRASNPETSIPPFSESEAVGYDLRPNTVLSSYTGLING